MNLAIRTNRQTVQPRIEEVRYILRTPHRHTNSELRSACNYAVKNGDDYDRHLAADIAPGIPVDDVSDSDPKLTRAALIAACIIAPAFYLWGIPLVAAFIQWGGTILRGVL